MVKTKNREITDSFLFDIDSYRKEKHKYEPSNICEMPIKWSRAENFNVYDRYKFVEKLLDISPNHFDKLVLLNSGSEATDAAYRLIKLWGKKNKKKYIVTFTGSYHGRVLGSDLMGGNKNSTDWSNMSDDEIMFLSSKVHR